VDPKVQITNGQWRGSVWRGPLPRNVRSRVGVARPPEEGDLGFGVVPDSPLARLMARLQRPERRLLLAAIQSKPGPRRDRLNREFARRAYALGISPE
jgi:hypothetical protein